MIVGTVASYLGHLHEKFGVSVVGKIERGLPPPTFPSLNNINELFVPAITIAAVSLSISISIAKMFSRKHGYKVSSNQVSVVNSCLKISVLLQIGTIGIWNGKCCFLVFSMLS